MNPAQAPRRRRILQFLEEPRLKVAGADVAGCRDQCPDLAPADEPTTTELDALEPARAGPAADRRWLEPDVGRGQDLACLGQGDPIGGGGHDQSADVAGADGSVPPLAAAGFGLASAGLALESPVEPGSGELSPEPGAGFWVASDDSPDSADRVGFALAPLRSFLAQPDPLKWIVGGLNALLRVPRAPQAGQAAGALPLIEWRISVVLWQFEQM